MPTPLHLMQPGLSNIAFFSKGHLCYQTLGGAVYFLNLHQYVTHGDSDVRSCSYLKTTHTCEKILGASSTLIYLCTKGLLSKLTSQNTCAFLFV